MAVPNIERMQTLLDMARSEEDRVLQAYQAIQLQLNQNQEQLDSLVAYRQDYVKSMTEGERSFFPSQFHATQAFLDKLNKAVQTQTVQVEQISRTEQEAQQAWIYKRARTKALEKLLSKMKLNESVRLGKIEQKMLDELSSQKVSRQPNRFADDKY